MSTLKSINVVHPSSAVNNIVNDASGNVAVGNNLTVAGTATVGGVAAVAVAPSTAGNVLTSTGSAWASSAPAATASLTLLATLTTTSGTTQSATGLPTTYTNLMVSGINITNATGNAYVYIAGSANNGSSYGAGLTVGPFNTPSSFTTVIAQANLNTLYHPTFNAGTLTTSTSGAINALQFSWSNSAAFNGGTIYIYGWN
jgi:hypothetical protein